MLDGIARDLKRLRFWGRFATHMFAALGAMAVVAGSVDVFSNGALSGQGYLAAIGLLAAAIYGGVRAWPRPIATRYDSPATSIRVVRGDILSQDTHLAIGVCDTFDTAFPHIAPRSVQGQFQSGVYSGDLAQLDRDIADALATISPVGTIVKEGKTSQYEVGTVVTVRNLARRFFLVAYTSMDEHNKAHGTPDGLWKSLGHLWRAVRRESNGTPISVPVFGGGQSGLSPVLPAEDAIRFIALSFMIASRAERVCEELRIVVWPDQYDRLNHLELQAFLKGLSRA